MTTKIKSSLSKEDKWLQTIAAYEREFKKWESRVDKIIKRYKDDGRKESDSAKFNILWSNIQTIVPAVFARLPKPDVSRRFRDTDPVGRVASLILERALDFEIDHYSDYRSAMKSCVTDRYLGGRGTAWVRYEPHTRAIQLGEHEDGVQVTEDIDEPQEELDYECAPVDYVNWKDFGHTIARTWEEVTAVWRKVYMGRSALIERFGEEWGKKIPLDTKPNEKEKMASDEDIYQALIYEIWDKESKKAIWLSKSLGEVIDERDDPLELEDFWPCPRPLFATLTSDSLVPVPDFTLYQDQAKELDILSDRIDGLVKALKVQGCYDASVPELSRIFTEASNVQMIGVKNWMAFAEKNGLAGAISLVDLKPIAEALAQAYQAMEQIKGQIYEITGMADIMRGQSDPAETATAVQLKGNYGSLRLKSMQGEVSEFAAELLRIKAQIMCKQFSPETLIKISAVDQLQGVDRHLIPQAIMLLQSEPMRNFRIEVTADSMIQMDEMQEKQDRMEFLGAVGKFLEQAVQAIGQTPQLAPLAGELLKFGVTGFKVGRALEGSIDQTIDQLTQIAQQPKPDPEAQKAQTQMQVQMQKNQLDAQAKERDAKIQIMADREKAQIAAQLEAHKQEMQAQQVMQQNQIEAHREVLQQQNEAAMERMRQQHESMMQGVQQQIELLIARLNNAAKVEVAEIAAQTTLDAAQISSARQASDE